MTDILRSRASRTIRHAPWLPWWNPNEIKNLQSYLTRLRRRKVTSSPPFLVVFGAREIWVVVGGDNSLSKFHPRLLRQNRQEEKAK